MVRTAAFYIHSNILTDFTKRFMNWVTNINTKLTLTLKKACTHLLQRSCHEAFDGVHTQGCKLFLVRAMHVLSLHKR